MGQTLRNILITATAFAFLSVASRAAAQGSPLGTAANFGVLGGSSVTNAGTTQVTGNVGVFPGSTVAGFPPGIVTGGMIHAGNATAAQAQTDTTAAYNSLVSLSCTTNLTGTDLGGLTLVPGVYCFSSAAALTGTLTLDAQGAPGAQFIFQIAGNLTTAGVSQVVRINSAQACNVFWQVGGSATLGAGSTFSGNILANNGIGALTAANVAGRLLARSGGVTLDSNIIGCGVTCPTITVAPSTLPNGTVGTPYNQTITASGGTAPYTFAITTGALPTGLTFTSAGNLSGTPASAGTFNFTVRATDSAGCFGDRSYTVIVTTPCPVITVSPATLPNGTAGTPYNQTITASGGTAPYTFAIATGTLPAGLTFTSAGNLSGTPASAGTFNFTVRATDSAGCFGDRSYTVIVTSPCPVITVSPSTLPNGTAGTPYNQTITASGGMPPYVFGIVAGALPSGLTLSSAGVLAGTPAAGGTFNFTVRATDGLSCFGDRAYTLVVGSGCPAISISPATLPNGTAGTPYNQTITASGGTAPYVFAVFAGALPSGVTLSSGGALSGTPSTAGTFNFTLKATDALSCVGSRSYTVVIGTATRPCPQTASVLFPSQGASGVPTSGFFQYRSPDAAAINVYFGLAGSGCSTLYTTTTGFARYSDLAEGQHYELRVEGRTAGCPTVTSECVRFTTAANCPQPPALIAPAPGTIVSSPVTFRWSAVAGATGYAVFASVDGGSPEQIGTTGSQTTLVSDLKNGAVNWYVVASVPNCGPLQSAGGTFGSCSLPPAPTAAVVAESTSAQTYALSWDAVGQSYEVQEATNALFANALTIPTTATSLSFTKNADTPLPFFYRVRASASCQQGFGAYSETVRIVIVPPPQRGAPEVNANVPAGSMRPVTVEVFVEGQGQPANFRATVDQEFMSVEPGSGVMPAEGLTFRVTLNPSALPNGVFSGTLIVTFPDPQAGRRIGRNDTAAPKSSTVSITLATPASPARPTSPSADSAVIPGLGHLEGVKSFRSDVRIANPTSSTAAYELTLTPGDRSVLPKSLTIRVAPGDTTALDDIVRRWFGIGSIPGESGVAALAIRPVSTGAGSSGSPVLASSRTFATSGRGTLGQFIPPVPFSKFIRRAGAVLSLQQIAQNTRSRTNVGLVEAAGESASVLLSVFDALGNRVRDIPVELLPREQLNLNSLLSLEGLTLTNGRIEVRVTEGNGRVTAFASVIDTTSGDQFYTPPVVLNEGGSTRYVFPGATRLTTPAADWRTDLQIFNSSDAAQPANVTFYPQGGNSSSADITIGPREVRALDDVIATLFRATGGGALHVSTPNSSSLVVTGRTYNLSGAGATGQFISAVPLEQGAQAGGKLLHLLQLEDSPRYRTNVGVAEMSGAPATVELQVFLPGSKATATIEIPLAAFQFRQFALREVGLGNVYNVRVAMRVVSGNGRVTAYGSLIDLGTGDATFIPAQ